MATKARTTLHPKSGPAARLPPKEGKEPTTLADATLDSETSTPTTGYAKMFEDRVTVIREGDTVMLELPSEVIKVVTIKRGNPNLSNLVVSMGKFGGFPISQLVGKHYNITYEITPSTPLSASGTTPAEDAAAAAAAGVAELATMGRKAKSRHTKVLASNAQREENRIARLNVLRPRPKARIQELEETGATNELIDDNPLLSFLSAPRTIPYPMGDEIDHPRPSTSSGNAFDAVLSPEEIALYRAQGLDYDEMIGMLMERHERFGLKTEYSKEKWKKRKEKKYGAFVTPRAPTLANIIAYHNDRVPAAILNMRIDSMSQILNLAAIRPGGRYLLVDDTSGLMLAAMLERMGGIGSVMLFTENDSPPAWAVLDQMNLDKRMIERCVKWMNWYEASDDYKPLDRQEASSEDEQIEAGPSGISTAAEAAAKLAKRAQKDAMKNRRRMGQEAGLDAKRRDLRRADWDGLVCACEISPPSVLSRLSPFLAGSATVTVYSQYSSICAETLQYMRDRRKYLAPTMTESWMRRYQVLPMRTHPTMMTSATGGFIVHATRVHPTPTSGPEAEA